jgi:hypothetical protein
LINILEAPRKEKIEKIESTIEKSPTPKKRLLQRRRKDKNDAGVMFDYIYTREYKDLKKNLDIANNELQAFEDKNNGVKPIALEEEYNSKTVEE